MEDLNKTQLVLLTLLVSFVTSIATGIITVSLLQEAPTEITQTVNRVVEKTIEQVAPQTNGDQASVKEVTVVVNEEDRVIDSIQKNEKSVVRIQYDQGDGTTPFYGIGVLIDKNGIVVTDMTDIFRQNYSFKGTTYDGSKYDLRYRGESQVRSLVFFEIIKNSQSKLVAEPATISGSDLKLGQTVIAIDGQDRSTVSVGRVTALVPSQPGNLTFIESDMASSPSVYGGPLLNLSGEVVGLRISPGNEEPFIASKDILTAKSELSL